MMGFGFIVARFGLFLREFAMVQGLPQAKTPHLSLWIGTALIVLGVLVCLLSTREYIDFNRRIRRGDPFVLPSSFQSIAVSISLSLVGLFMAGYLIWVAI
jgi:putative membrane protein